MCIRWLVQAETNRKNLNQQVQNLKARHSGKGRVFAQQNVSPLSGIPLFQIMSISQSWIPCRGQTICARTRKARPLHGMTEIWRFVLTKLLPPQHLGRAGVGLFQRVNMLEAQLAAPAPSGRCASTFPKCWGKENLFRSFQHGLQHILHTNCPCKSAIVVKQRHRCSLRFMHGQHHGFE